MPTIRYWRNRYNGFLKYLNGDLDGYREACANIEAEREDILYNYLELKATGGDCIAYTLYVTINHEWNLIRPIKEVWYPEVRNEYSL